MTEISSNESNTDNYDFKINDDRSATSAVDNDEKFYALLVKLENLASQPSVDLQEHAPVLQSILIYANKVFEPSNYSDLNNVILRELISYSNKTVLIPCLIKTEYPRVLLKWLHSIPR